MHAKRVCQDFEMKKFGEYHDLYVQSNTLFLADEFENFKKMCLKISCSFPFCTRISIASRLKKSKVSIIWSINPIQDGGRGQKEPPTSFSPVTCTNVGLSPQNVLTFSFNPFATMVIPSASPKLLNLNQDHSSKKVVFLAKSLQNWCYNNFSNRNPRVTKLRWHDHIYSIIWVT